MDNQVWIGKAFQEGHVFELSAMTCCDQRYPVDKAKFCMVCGEELTEYLALSLKPEFCQWAQILADLRPDEESGSYPREQVWLNKHISAKWLPCFGGFHLVVGIYLGGSSSPPGYRGTPLLLKTQGADDGGDFSWSFKTVNEFFSNAFSGSEMWGNLRAGLIFWASGLKAGPDVYRWDAQMTDISKLTEGDPWA